jgi:polysaccharide pyruvyl transferase WcaK-like protein
MSGEREQRFVLAEHIRSVDRVMVLNGAGVHNVGDEAILEGILHQLPRRQQAVVVSRDPRDTRQLHGVRAVAPWLAPLTLLRTQVLVIGGGMFSSHMGPMQRLIPWFVRLALFLHVRCLFIGVGIYANTPPKILRRMRAIMPRLAQISVRDGVCADVVTSLGGAVEVIPDLANHMPSAPLEQADDILIAEGIPPERPLIGLALTATGLDDAEVLAETFVAVIEGLPEANFVFLPMSQHPWVPRHNDLVLAERIATRAPNLHIIRGWYGPEQILALFARFDVAVCMRYHSLLFAWRQGCAIIALPYSPKCDDFIGAHGLQQAEFDAAAIRRDLDRLTGSAP